MTITSAGPPPTVMLVDPSEETRRYLSENLGADQYVVNALADAVSARRELRTGRPDLLIVDVDLPDAAGLDLIGMVRSGGADDPWDSGMPIVAISGCGDVHRIVRTIERGADDVVCRPYDYSELLARCGAVLRRSRGATVTDELRIGPLVVDRRARRAVLNGRIVELSAKEFALLDALARDPRRVLTKQELLRDVWGYVSVGRTRTVDSHASRLRRKLAMCGAAQRYVANVWGVGYRLLPDGV